MFVFVVLLYLGDLARLALGFLALLVALYWRLQHNQNLGRVDTRPADTKAFVSETSNSPQWNMFSPSK